MRNTTIFLITIVLISMLTNFKLYAGQNTGFGIYIFHGIGTPSQPDNFRDKYQHGSHYGIGISYNVSKIAAFGLEYSSGKFDFDLDGFKNNALLTRPLIVQGEAAEIKLVCLKGILDIPYHYNNANFFLSGCAGLSEFLTKDQRYLIIISDDRVSYNAKFLGKKLKDNTLLGFGIGIKFHLDSNFKLITTGELIENYMSTGFTMRFYLLSVAIHCTL